MRKTKLEKVKVYVGIDPGKEGAIAFYTPKTKKLHIVDWPSSDSESEIIHTIEPYCNAFVVDVAHCVLEKVSSMPKQGVVSVFSFGMNFGIWKGITAFFGWKRSFLTPQAWRKGLVTPSDGPDPKKANYNVCTRLFPDYESFTGPKGAIKDGRVDAALMAYKAWKMEHSE
jgi:crossover junction endodeoxyribonuclease RuvC